MRGITTFWFSFTGILLTWLAVESNNGFAGIFGSILGVGNVLIGLIGAYRSE